MMTGNRMFAAALVAALAIATGTAHAADLLVPQQHATIQAAIDAANPGDTVIVDDGVYTGAGNRDLNFGGKAITVRSANGPLACVIDCQGTPQDPHRGFIFSSGETNASVVEGFTICNGSTLPGAIADDFNGGAILCNNHSSPTIRHCIMRDNWAGCWGAAVSCGWDVDAHPVIDGCLIINNYSDDDGGALFAVGASATVRNTIIANNEARVTGGGIGNFGGGTFIVRNSTIVGNIAPSGAGVQSWNADIGNSIIRDNVGNVQVNVAPGSIRFSNIQDGFDGTGNVDLDPLFVNALAGDFHLDPNSPMINAGDPNYLPQPGEQDADGDPRVLRGSIDMGADEFRPLGDVNIDGEVTVLDLLIVLAEWGPCSDCAADLNGDQQVNILDLLVVLANWGA